MAAVRTRSAPDFVERLKTTLIRDLKISGITAQVTFERVPTTKLYRVLVLAKKFQKLGHSERQRLVWSIADGALSRDEQLRISMIHTLTPREASEG